MTEQERMEQAYKALRVTCPWAAWPEFEAGWNAVLSADGEPVAWAAKSIGAACARLWEYAPKKDVDGVYYHGEADSIIMPPAIMVRCIGRDLQPGECVEVLRFVVREPRA